MSETIRGGGVLTGIWLKFQVDMTLDRSGRVQGGTQGGEGPVGDQA
jgi:hypothetical protein